MLALLIIAVLGGPARSVASAPQVSPAPSSRLKSCLAFCYADPPDGVEDCVYDSVPACPIYRPMECVESQARRCRARVVNLGEWAPALNVRPPVAPTVEIEHGS